MGFTKSSAKREIHSNTSLSQDKRENKKYLETNENTENTATQNYRMQ